MCLFSFANGDINSTAYKKGVHSFECGACPECLSKRARLWALRCFMQAKVQDGCMITLTYDSYIRDKRGKIIGERVSDLQVNKKDCQDFIKRLRRYFEYHYGEKDIKYLITAEYGSRTHRPHYHAILFGVRFRDLVHYKKSKRGNIIYLSDTLKTIWGKGICTVDSINISPSIARYCTKYCAKDARSEDTFMLVSRGIGQEKLMEEFNGLYYMVDGKEYPIPRTVWRDYIEKKYKIPNYSRYISYKSCCCYFDNLESKFLDSLEKTVSQRERLLDALLDTSSSVQYWRKRAAKFRSKNTLAARCLTKYENLYSLYSDRYNSLSSSISTLTGAIDSLRKAYKVPFVPDFEKYFNRDDSSLDILSRYMTLFYANDRAIMRYKRFRNRRQFFIRCRDNDSLYKRYVQYWSKKGELYEKSLPDSLTRILQLPDGKYFAYKQAALRCYNDRLQRGADDAIPPPRSNCVSRYERGLEKRRKEGSLVWHLPFTPSCHIKANDTKSTDIPLYRFLCTPRKGPNPFDHPQNFPVKPLQLNIYDIPYQKFLEI